MRGLFGALAGGLRTVQFKSTDISALTWSRLFGGDLASKAGVSVNIDSALRVSTVLACARVIAEGIAQIPLKLYAERADGGKDVAVKNPLHRLLSRRPNDWMSSFEFREMLSLHAVLTGAGWALIVRNTRGEPLELIPVPPGCVTVNRGPTAADLTVTLSDAGGQIETYSWDSFLRIAGPTWNGWQAMNMIQLARESIGLAIATEENHSRLFSNGARPGGVLAVEGNLGLEARNRLKQAWNDQMQQVGNAYKTAVLPGNVKFTPLAMTGLDSQALESRKFQIEEICRTLKVFPQMVGHSDKTSTFASAEAFFLAHVIYTLLPWVTRWEQSINRCLIDRADSEHFAGFSVQGLLRGDAKTRAAFYQAGVQNGWFTRNEVRLWEDLNPLPGLDEPLVPLNMGTQAERDAAAVEIVEAVKAMIGHNGGPPLDGLEQKIGRVLSARNERRIRDARDNLDNVLDTLPAAAE